MPRFITEVTLRNPPLEAADADEARRRVSVTYDKLVEILARNNVPPQIVEIEVQEVEDTDG
jgi:hypothetical protein